MIRQKTIFKINFLVFLLMAFVIQVNECFSQTDNSMSGRYINMTFLEQLPDQIPGSIPVYCLEINFTGSDSAEIYNGFEEFKLAYRKEGDNFLFVKAVQGNDLSFINNEAGVIILADSVWTGRPTKSVFRNGWAKPDAL